MPSQPNMLFGFLSYAHADNEHDKRAIQRIARRIAGEVRAQTGNVFDIFVDAEDVRVGEHWKNRIITAIESSICLVAIMTPSYFSSGHCRREYEYFKKREAELARCDLIIPIYYITVDEIRYKKRSTQSDWIDDLSNRQYIDWRSLRFQTKESKQSHEFVREIAKRIHAIVEEIDGHERGVLLPKYEYPFSAPPPGSEEFETYVIDAFSRLSTTQRYIVQIVYNLHNDEIGLDDLFRLFVSKYGEALILSDAELHYRVKDLVVKGFLSLQPLGYKTTLVLPKPIVAEVLSKKFLLRSG